MTFEATQTILNAYMQKLAAEEYPEKVRRPAHYNQGEIECCDALRSALGDDGFIDYCKGNVMKYVWRAGHKESEDEDLLKSLWYLKMILHVRKLGPDPRDPKDVPESGK